jgi:hypothetical protein
MSSFRSHTAALSKSLRGSTSTSLLNNVHILACKVLSSKFKLEHALDSVVSRAGLCQGTALLQVWVRPSVSPVGGSIMSHASPLHPAT